MFNNEYEPELRRRDMQRAAENETLVKIATEGTPTLWQRINARLPQVEITAPTVRVVAKQPSKAIAWQ